MPEKHFIRSCLIFLIALFIAVTACVTTVSADDARQLKLLPGRWNATTEIEKEGEDEGKEVSFVLTLGDNGTMTLVFSSEDEEYAYTYGGTWSAEYDPDSLDRLTLSFISTDNPVYAGNGYGVECVFDFYTESWEENDTRYIYTILEENHFSGVTPFEDVYGHNSLALNRVYGPNMRVVNCKEYVSLRVSPSTSVKRRAKVPLGALVLTFPEYEEENGFLFCMYHGDYGYILAEYLEPVE